MLASLKESVGAAPQRLEVARTIVRAIESRKPKLRYIVRRDARLVLTLCSAAFLVLTRDEAGFSTGRQTKARLV
jgi:hypothetical protein